MSDRDRGRTLLLGVVFFLAACSELTVPPQVSGTLHIDESGIVSVEVAAEAGVAGCSVPDLELRTERSGSDIVVTIDGYRDQDPSSVDGDCTELNSPVGDVVLGLLDEGDALRIQLRLDDRVSEFRLRRTLDEISITATTQSAGSLRCDGSGRRAPLSCQDRVGD